MPADARVQALRLDRAFFNCPTLTVAPALLGKFLVCGERAAMITETEAYKGPRDRACHTFRGRRTTRVEPLYGEGGLVYVYLVYGLHWLLNFSTAGPGQPEGVLIRAVMSEDADALKHVVGPGRVTQWLGIDGGLSGQDACLCEGLRLEDRGVRIPASRILRGPRVGIDYAGPYWAARPWRYRLSIDVAREALQGRLRCRDDRRLTRKPPDATRSPSA